MEYYSSADADPGRKRVSFITPTSIAGNNEQECRLIDANPRSPRWHPDDFKCPVPDILAANSNPNMVLEATVRKGIRAWGGA